MKVSYVNELSKKFLINKILLKYCFCKIVYLYWKDYYLSIYYYYYYNYVSLFFDNKIISFKLLWKNLYLIKNLYYFIYIYDYFKSIKKKSTKETY